jgi:hypothetical protein
VGQHLAGGVEVAVGVVEERRVEEGPALVGHQVVVDQLELVAALALGRAAKLVAGSGS